MPSWLASGNDSCPSFQVATFLHPHVAKPVIRSYHVGPFLTNHFLGAPSPKHNHFSKTPSPNIPLNVRTSTMGSGVEGGVSVGSKHLNREAPQLKSVADACFCRNVCVASSVANTCMDAFIILREPQLILAAMWNKQ